MADAVQRAFFFLSHADTGSAGFEGSRVVDTEVADFFHLLCRHLRHLTTIDASVSPGFLDERMNLGTPWHPELLSALASCQVFVPLYSRRYFESEWCGREWDAFRRREEAHRRNERVGYPFSAIVPVLWTDADTLRTPPCAAGLQHSNYRMGRRYTELGIYGLQILDPPGYQMAAFQIARTIRDVAEATRLRPCRPEELGEPTNAFTEDR